MQAELSASEKRTEKRTADLIAASEKRLKESLASKANLEVLEKHIDEKFDSVLNAVGERLNDTESVVEDHGQRIGRLERLLAD